MMLAKELLLACVLLILAKDALSADCSNQSCLRRLYNSKVIKAEYYTRPLDSSSDGCSGGVWYRKKRSGLRQRLPHFNYHYLHAGVVVTLERSVEGNDRWLIHKGRGYGGSQADTVITDANYMLPGWTRVDYEYISYCNKYVIDFMRAALINTPYSLGRANCQHAANGMWDMVQRC